MDNRNGKDESNNPETHSGIDDDTDPIGVHSSGGATPPRLGDETNGASGEPDPVALAKAEAEVARKEHLYLRAEFENFKKLVLRERSELRKFAAEKLVVDLLSVLDILETALSTQVTAESLENFRKGIQLTATELKSALQRHGVEELPAEGKAFDPSIHDALTSEESDLPAGSITRVFKKPYKLHDRVVRPGQVVVAKPKG